VTARRITPDDADYQRLWQLVNKNNANRYYGYQSKTSRPMAIFALTPS
jgi:F420H(2)-dependent quinone reductase